LQAEPIPTTGAAVTPAIEHSNPVSTAPFGKADGLEIYLANLG
jgi:hypothetical protein